MAASIADICNPLLDLGCLTMATARSKRKSSSSKAKRTRGKKKRAPKKGARASTQKSASFGRWLRLGEFFAIGLVFTVLVGMILFFSYRNFTTKSVLVDDAPWTVNVPRGGTVWGTWRHLVRDGAVEPSRWFAVWVAFEKPDCLQAGAHTIPKDATLGAMFETLCEPTSGSGMRLVVPEGMNVWSIADRLQGARITSRSAFVEQAMRPMHIPLYELHAPTAEGFLFPDTWEFEEGTPAEEIVEKMQQRFVDVWKQVNEANPQGLATVRERWGLGLYEVVTLASIVEKEAVVDAERPLIARVIYNRLERGMRVQCDPTCVYGSERYREKPSPKWCRHEANEWSTYANDGLPPTPIANPGRASLAAAITPADAPDVLYFASKMDGSGRHVFASTYEDHKANVKKYLRGR